MAKSKWPRALPAVGEGKRGTPGHIAYLVRQAHGAIRSALDTAMSDVGLTTPQFLILNLVNAYPDASGAQLARIAQLTPQTVNLIVRKLERDKLIARKEHETHGRVLQMQLTSAGITRLEQCKDRADGVERQILAFMDATTEQKVRRWLSDVAAALLHI